MTYEEFVDNVMMHTKICPPDWRKGQCVFVVVDYHFDVARECQFTHGVDCFYDDSQIDAFLRKAYEIIQERGLLDLVENG